ncbi:MAG: Gfo/Idh/MocA family oxidoreductase [Planctomycetaceae bacterium]
MSDQQKNPNALLSHDSGRRNFLRTTATMAAGLFVAAPQPVFAQSGDKLKIAVIGCGGRGGSNLKSVSSEHITALCDVNESNLNRAAESYSSARKATDFRRIFDHPDEFDAVVVSTCEHTHAFATLPALQLGKHVYCEKPLTHNVREARIIREAAGRAGVATQMGTQIHAGENYRRVVELIQTGAIGKVTECHVWVSRAWGWHATKEEADAHKDIVFVQERPKTSDPIPANLNWDLWLGPALERPFSNVYFPGPKWYRWWDFGNGTMSDLGSHWIDLPFWALNLKYPARIEASGPPVNSEIAPASMQVRYEYEEMGSQPQVSLTWYQGTNRPEILSTGQIPAWGNGVLFIGENGMLLADYGKHVLLPEEKFVDFKRPDPYLPPSLGHHQEWIHACKTGAPTTCNFEYAGWLTEANHLGNVAYRTGKSLQWDAAEMRATNAPEADRFITREYRKGWSLG